MRRSFRRAACDVRTLVAVVIAFACGLMLYRAAAGAWMKAVVAAAMRASDETQFEIANWKAVEAPGFSSFSADSITTGVVFDQE